jgi:hypothetical protein
MFRLKKFLEEVYETDSPAIDLESTDWDDEDPRWGEPTNICQFKY